MFIVLYCKIKTALTQINRAVNTLNVKVKTHEIEQALLHRRFLSVEESAGSTRSK